MIYGEDEIDIQDAIKEAKELKGELDGEELYDIKM